MTAPRYETSDLYLAAFVLSQDISLAGSVRASARRILFQFPANEQLHDCLRLYWHGVPVTLVPAKLCSSIQYLKSLIRSQP